MHTAAERPGQTREAASTSFPTADSRAAKAMRFGCGAVLAIPAVLAVALTGVLGPVGTDTLLLGALVLAVLFGFLCVSVGDRFVETLLKLLTWLV